MYRYTQIRSLDVTNGEGIGASIFVQGCDNHCKGCFNPETWDFNGGKEWTQETEDYFLSLLDKPFIKRVSILGGEPLADKNIELTYRILYLVKRFYPDKTIWLWTGFKLHDYNFDPSGDFDSLESSLRMSVIQYCDFIIDGPFIEEQKDLTLAFRGSTNQRVIDVKKTLDAGEIILYDSNNI